MRLSGFRPLLEALEDRFALSTMRVDFSEDVTNGKILVPTQINVLFQARDGTTYQRSFPAAHNELATDVRDRIVNAMTAAGWNVMTVPGEPAAFEVQGFGALGGNSTVKHANAYMPGIREKYQPKITVVKDATDSNTMDVSFMSMGGVLGENVTFHLNIGGNDIAVAMPSGTTTQNALLSLYTQLQQSGYNATLSGDSVLFDTSLDVDAYWTGADGTELLGNLYVDLERLASPTPGGGVE